MEKDFMFDVYLFEGQLKYRTQVVGSDSVMAEASEESLQ